MKTFNSTYNFVSKNSKDCFSANYLPEKGHDLVVVQGGNKGLVHFYYRSGQVYRKFMSEMCQNVKVTDGKLIELSFNQYKALCLVSDENNVIFLGSSFVSVRYFMEGDITAVWAIEEFYDKEVNENLSRDRWFFIHH